MKIKKNDSIIKPSVLVTYPFLIPSIAVLLHSRKKTTAASKVKGISFHIVDFLNLIVVIIAPMPRIKRILAILLPIIFPNAMSVVPFNEAYTLTISSGREVPKATTVSPIASFEMPNLLAMDEELSTKKPAPLINRKIPIANNIYSIIVPLSQSIYHTPHSPQH